jgi:hypothetical protein
MNILIDLLSETRTYARYVTSLRLWEETAGSNFGIDGSPATVAANAWDSAAGVHYFSTHFPLWSDRTPLGPLLDVRVARAQVLNLGGLHLAEQAIAI